MCGCVIQCTHSGGLEGLKYVLSKALVSSNAHKLLHHNRPQAYFRRYSIATLAEIWVQDTRYIQQANLADPSCLQVNLQCSVYLNSLTTSHPAPCPTPSYLKDTTDLLQETSQLGHLPPGSILVTLNVSSLHTTIPHDEGEEACRGALDTRILDTLTTIHSSASADGGGDGDSLQFCT